MLTVPVVHYLTDIQLVLVRECNSTLVRFDRTDNLVVTLSEAHFELRHGGNLLGVGRVGNVAVLLLAHCITGMGVVHEVLLLELSGLLVI